MFSNDDLVRNSLTDPDELWFALDSFWRSETTDDTRDLVHYHTWAALLLELNIHAKANHLTSAQSIPTAQQFLTVPWFPIVLFQDRLQNQSYYLYGGGNTYNDPAEIVYGEQSGDPRFRYPLTRPFYSFSTFCDSVTETSVVVDQSQFEYDPTTGRLTFFVDPFTLIPSKTTSGRPYIVLWARNPQVDLNVPFDFAGWVLRYRRSTTDRYIHGLTRIWRLVSQGPSLGRFYEGLLATTGLPYAEAEEVVRRVENDGYQLLISTDTTVYKALNAAVSAVVAPGDLLYEGQPLTDGIQLLEYTNTLSASAADVPGLLLKVPLSNGSVATLTFKNEDTQWDYESGRTSEFRFPVGGPEAAVEQFWADVDTFSTDNGVSLETLYSLTTPGSDGPTGDSVNPYKLVVQDLLGSRLVVVTADLADIPYAPGSFADRAAQLLPQDILLVMQQSLGSTSDSFDLGSNTADTVTVGYNETVPTETISVSGTDLTYTDLTPLVVIT